MADPMQDPSMGQDPTQDPSQGDDQQSSGFSVTITDNGDGSFTVSSSDDDGDSDDGQGGGSQTAQSVEEACEMAGEMLQQEAGESDGGDQSDPKAVWNQLAKKSDKARAV